MDDLIPPMGHGMGADPTSWNLEEGDEIARGRHALKKLGGGRDYEAYLAWDETLMSLVVAKCLRPHLMDDDRSRRLLEREAGHLLTLNHPVIVRGFDAVLEEPRPHVVMEFLEGPNLASLIKASGAIAIEQLVPLAVQICSALHYLVTQRVVHLDVKPRNIIMGAPPRLIDLSLARTYEEAAALHSPVGTDPYMAPEQCDPQLGPPGAAADVWGLGATLHHALAGSVPFPRPDYERDLDEDRPDVRFPQLRDDPEPLPRDTPPQVSEVVRGCLARVPEARPSPATIVEGLEPLVTGIPDRPVLRRLRPRLGSRRSRD